jgi:hypothetical protein
VRVQRIWYWTAEFAIVDGDADGNVRIHGRNGVTEYSEAAQNLASLLPNTVGSGERFYTSGLEITYRIHTNTLPGYQTRINALLRAFVDAQRRHE